MTLRIISGKRKLTFNAPTGLICLVVSKALKAKCGATFGSNQRRELIKSLRRAKENFGKLTLAEITKKDEKKVIITL